MRWHVTVLFFGGSLSTCASANDILKTSGFTTCIEDSKISVENLHIQFDRQTNQLVFDVKGTSTEEQKTLASLSVSAYGKEVYSREFNPCDNATKVDQLCPSKSTRDFGTKISILTPIDSS